MSQIVIRRSTGGKYYVDNQCIDCDLCRETAPNNFTRSDDGGYSYVYKQPSTPDEENQCKEAKEGCPSKPSATTANSNQFLPACGPIASCDRALFFFVALLSNCFLPRTMTRFTFCPA